MNQHIEVERPLNEPWQEVSDSFETVFACMQAAKEFLFSQQRSESFWCAELESNATITAEYVFLCQCLHLEIESKRERLSRYLLGQQNPDGSWGIAVTLKGDVSTTAEVYLALTILGLPRETPALLRAERFIVAYGGLEAVRVFTRIFFAMFGLIPWSAIPALSPEFVLLPPLAAVNIYSLSSWARSTMIPLFIIFHHKPIFALPNGRQSENPWLDHLWLNKQDKRIPYMPSWWELLLQKGLCHETIFGTLDKFLQLYEPWRVKRVREKSLEKCLDYVLLHQEDSGDWGGIFPPMINGVLALVLEGYSLESTPVKKALAAIEKFSWQDSRGLRIQACVSPVWDTALSLIALIDSGVSREDPRLKQAARWLIEKEINCDHGDWRIYGPKVSGGGWSFEYHNTWFPDIDDTAAVLLALCKLDPENKSHPSVQRAVDWILGMQNRDGGWAAFDLNNDKLYLNKIPFSDMNSLCDTSCPDVTGRVLEIFGMLLQDQQNARLKISVERALGYLQRSQEANGSWFGRWGVNYVYGTSNVLCGLTQLRMPATHPMIKKATNWLMSIQNSDGGWGESLTSYDLGTFVHHSSTPSQTAWALMGLMKFLSVQSGTIADGISWLTQNQTEAISEPTFEGGEPVPLACGATWNEIEATATGFPQHFYLRYHLYRHYFPMMALGRYLRLRAN